MADSKITALTAISTVDPAADPLVIVDVSDTSMAASGTTKKSTINQLLGAGGTATLASATITGDLTVDTSTLKVDSANDRVGVGITAPGYKLHVGSATYASVGTSIDSITQTSHVFKGTPDAAGYEHAKIVSGRESSPFTYGSFLAFYTEGKNSGTTDTSVERARFNSTGNLAFANGLGIDFSATPSGSGTMTSELLSDYEEGTWTGTIKGSISDPTTPVTATGRYTKIGRVVTVQLAIENVVTTGASGIIYVSGVPFVNGGASTFGSGASSAGANFTGTLTSYIGNGQTNLFFVAVNSGALTSDATHNAGSGRSFWLNITYTV